MGKFGNNSVWNKARATSDDLVEDMVFIGMDEEFVFAFYFEIVEELFIIFWGYVNMLRMGKGSFKEFVVGFASGNKHRVEGFGFIKGFRDGKGLFLPIDDQIDFSEPRIS